MTNKTSWTARGGGSSSKKKAEAASPSHTFLAEPILSNDGILHQEGQTIYCSYIDLAPRTDAFLEEAQYTTDDDTLWRVNVGDFVCIQTPKGGSATDAHDAMYPPGKAVKCSPFSVAWRPCQILSIFRGDKLLEGMKVEVRWFYRLSDLDNRNRRYEMSLQNNSSKGGGELFETGHVAVVDASHLLAPLILKRDGNEEVSGGTTRQGIVPTSKNICYRYYLHKEQDILQLIDRDNMVIRGMQSSKQLKAHSSLRKATSKLLQLSIPKDGREDQKDNFMVTLPKHSLRVKYQEWVGTFYSSCQLTPRWSELSIAGLVCPSKRRRDFPTWQMCVGDIVAVYCDDDSEPPSGLDDFAGRHKWYPYNLPWSHAQIIAIYRKNVVKEEEEQDSVSVDASLIQCQIRWFLRVPEVKSVCNEKESLLLKLDEIASDTERTTEEIFEWNFTSEISISTILGPVRVDTPSRTHVFENDSPVPQFLPRNRRLCNFNVPAFKRIDFEPTTLVRRGIDVCKLFMNQHQREKISAAVVETRRERVENTKENDTTIKLDEFKMDGSVVGSVLIGKKRARQKLSNTVATDEEDGEPNTIISSNDKSDAPEATPRRNVRRKATASSESNSRCINRVARVAEDAAESSSASDEEDDVEIELESRASCINPPFHVDVSSMKSFYKEIEVLPSLKSYAKTFRKANPHSPENGSWSVKIGDTVTLFVEESTKDAPASHFPFAVAWSPAEIVSIYREHKSKDSCLKLRESIMSRDGKQYNASTLDGDEGTVMLEVRWLYRRYEIPGAARPFLNHSDTDDDGLEEVLETDQLDVCSADSILSPIQLHEQRKPSTLLSSSFLGMPFIHYHCHRYWSIHRKTLLPSGSLSSRAERGRMHSSYYKTALGKLSNVSAKDETTKGDAAGSWKGAFQTAIKKLSLAEAAQDAQVHGLQLKCRDKEREKISFFLRKAIVGKETEIDSDGREGGTMNTKKSLFIAGPPGTGKTASVRSIIAEFQEEQALGNIPEFKFIDINGMELRHPYDAYVKFWEAISGIRKERETPGNAAAELENYFVNDEDYGDEEDIPRKPVTVLLLDEIDYLVTEKQTVLYNFFDWPLRCLSCARLIVIGISNTINLPERLTPKLQSRLGGDRVHFQSYNANDTITILKTRLDMMGADFDPTTAVFDEDGIKYAARKTANLSGDIRKAFHMMKVAAEKVFEEYTTGQRHLADGARPMVKISDVTRSSRDMFHSIIHRAIACSTAYQALILIAIGAMKRNSGRENGFTAKEILVKIESISDGSGETRYDARLAWADLIEMLNRLAVVRASVLPCWLPSCTFHSLSLLTLIFAVWNYPIDLSLHQQPMAIGFNQSSCLRNLGIIQKHVSQQVSRETSC
jgi:origin recognition complex subunit 1